MRKRTVKTWEVDGETSLLATVARGEGFRKAHVVIRDRDFTHRRVVGYAYRLEDARLFAATPALVAAAQQCLAAKSGWEHMRAGVALRAALKATKP